MIKELGKAWIKEHNLKIKRAIESKIGRRLVKGKDSVIVDVVHRENLADKTEFMYAAVVFAGDVYGFLEVDYSEPCLVFIPSSLLRDVWSK
jgi:hypothetical protein